MPGIVVKISTPAIARMSLPGGDVWEWTKDKGRKTKEVAIADCPKRDGHLASSHKLNLSKLPQGCYVRIENTAEYALWVHEGTRPVIEPDPPHKFLKLRPGHGWGTIYKESVVGQGLRSGQGANPWLSRALRRVMR